MVWGFLFMVLVQFDVGGGQERQGALCFECQAQFWNSVATWSWSYFKIVVALSTFNSQQPWPAELFLVSLLTFCSRVSGSAVWTHLSSLFEPKSCNMASTMLEPSGYASAQCFPRLWLPHRLNLGDIVALESMLQNYGFLLGSEAFFMGTAVSAKGYRLPYHQLLRPAICVLYCHYQNTSVTLLHINFCCVTSH